MTPGDDEKLNDEPLHRDPESPATADPSPPLTGEDEDLGDDDSYDAEMQHAPPLVQLRTEPARQVPAVLVRFRVPGQCAPCDPGTLTLKVADRVIIDSEHGQTLATVIRAAAPTMTDRPLSRVLRLVDPDDLRIIERNRVREREAFQFCVERIKARRLDMKLVAVELAHSGTRAVFYFSSTDRIDFRALVKDLARRFHTRIEMRQIGVRDGARHTGGTGLCGRELCCATWLTAFKPISIRMAKDQNLALNHQKLSGLCGRLRCCLEYEEEIYQSLRKGLPKVGKRVMTPQGEGRVKDVDVLLHKVRVQLMEGGYAQFDAAEVSRPADLQPPGARPAVTAALPKESRPSSPGVPAAAQPVARAPESQPPQAAVASPAPTPRSAESQRPENHAPLTPAPTVAARPRESFPRPSGPGPSAAPELGPDGQPLRTGRRRRRRRGRRHGRGGQGPDGGPSGPSSPPSIPSTPTG